MSLITVDPELCRRDGVCIAVCPSKTLTQNAEGLPEEIPGAHCIACGHCVAVCGFDAITHSGLPETALLPVPTDLPSPVQMDGLLKSRRSIRVYKDTPVPRTTMEELLDVARCAPTATNSQRLHWIVINGRERVHGLAEEVVRWMVSAGWGLSMVKRWESGQDFVLRGAPTLLIACAPSDYEWGKLDCAIALSYVELAAEARGLGACWAGYLIRASSLHPPLCATMQVPEGYAVCGGLMLGTSKYKYKKIPPRKPVSAQWLE